MRSRERTEARDQPPAAASPDRVAVASPSDLPTLLQSVGNASLARTRVNERGATRFKPVIVPPLARAPMGAAAARVSPEEIVAVPESEVVEEAGGLAAIASARRKPRSGGRTHTKQYTHKMGVDYVVRGAKIGTSRLQATFSWNRKLKRANVDMSTLDWDVTQSTVASSLGFKLEKGSGPRRIFETRDGSPRGMVRLDAFLDVNVCPAQPGPINIACHRVARLMHFVLWKYNGDHRGNMKRV